MILNHFMIRRYKLVIGYAVTALFFAAQPAHAVVVHRYLLDGDTNDSVGSLHLSAVDDFSPDFVADNIAGGMSAEFTGINAVLGDVPAGDPLRTSVFSLAFWMKYGAQPASYGMPIGRADSSNTPWQVQINPDGTITWIPQGANGGIIPPLNTGGGDADPWHHVVISQDYELASIYVDGVAVHQNTATPIVNANDGKPLRLGRRGDCCLFGGRLDDVQIYADALGPADVAFLHANPGQTVVPTTPGRLLLEVNRVTGETILRNPSSNPLPVELISYTLNSPNNALEASNARWNSLQDVGEPGWFEANPTATNLSELASAAPLVLMPGESHNFGNPFTVNTGAALGTNRVNLAGLNFKYQLPDGTEVPVRREDVRFNNLVLVVDPTTGVATLQNQSTQSIELISYTIHSNSGALSPSYAGSGQPNWFTANPTANDLSELSSGSSIVLNQGDELDLGVAWSTAGSQDLTFQYQATNGDLFAGTVHFGEKALISVVNVAGDYNGNGVVDAADYTLWRDRFGASAPPGTGADGDGNGLVGTSDYAYWKDRFGNSSGSGSLAGGTVPEPTCVSLCLLALGAMAGAGQRRR